MAKRRSTDNTMAKRRSTDNTMTRPLYWLYFFFWSLCLAVLL
jgi:preprotein translocase subunit SecG